jgi:hypothetical protein
MGGGRTERPFQEGSMVIIRRVEPQGRPPGGPQVREQCPARLQEKVRQELERVLYPRALPPAGTARRWM